MAENKVVFGLSKVYFGTYSVTTTGSVTLGTPMHVPGAVNLSLEADTEETVFWADNVKYYVTNADNGFTGDLEMAYFPDNFKTSFMNYRTQSDGGLAQVKGMKNKDVYMMFEADGDSEQRRAILYNIALGPISREYSTEEGNQEPKTATMPITVTGDNTTGVTRVVYGSTASGYSTLFTNPPVPSTN